MSESVSDAAAPETFGTRLRRLRSERGMLQADLAGSGLSASYVSLLESGRRQPTPPVVLQLAERLGVTVAYLREGVDDGALEQARLDLSYAELALRSGEPASALQAYREVLDRLRQPGAVPESSGAEAGLRRSVLVRQAQWGTGRALERTGQIEDAFGVISDFRSELDPADPLWIPSAVAAARCAIELGDIHRAVDIGETALLEVQDYGLEGTQEHAELTSTLVGAYQLRGDTAQAFHIAERLLATAERIGNPRARAAAYWNASVVAAGRGHRDRALLWAERAVALLSDADDERLLAKARVALAWMLLRSEPPDADRAIRELHTSVAALTDYGVDTDLAYARTELSMAFLLTGQPREALAEAVQAIDLLPDRGGMEYVTAMLARADACVALGDSAQARDIVASAIDELAGLPPAWLNATHWRHAAHVLRRLGDEDGAVLCLERALDQAGITSEPVPLRAPARAESRGQG